MTTCKNCFSSIDDMRKETRCTTCNTPLHRDCAIKDGGTFYCDVCYTVKEEGDSVKDVQIEIPKVIRRSYIETYKSCPFKVYNEVLKGIEAPPTIYTQMGIDLHSLFDKANHDKSYTSDMMKKDFEQIWNGYDEKLFDVAWDVNHSKMHQRATDSIDTFFDVIKDMPDPFKTEETIEFSIGDDLPKISTTSDRVNIVDGELEMVDWKTGAVMIGQKLSSDLQAPLYIYGVRQTYNMPVRKFTFYYLEENKQRVFEKITNEEYICTVNKRQYHINITDAIREVQSLFSRIKKGDFNIPRNTKSMYFSCKMCHLQKMEVCKGADVESWKQYNQGGR